MIQSLRNKATQDVWERRPVRGFAPELQRAAHRKLLILDAAVTLADLKIPPGNRLEKLTGDRAGKHSVRINDQWRICFRWTRAGPADVEIVDYH